MAHVFLLHHVYEHGGAEEVKLIGVYSTEASARAAIARLSRQPGFAERVEGFHLEAYKLDEDHWGEGFVEILPIEVQLEGSSETVTVHSTRLPSGCYELVPSAADSTERWLFKPGQTVLCEPRQSPNGDTHLLAVKLVAPFERLRQFFGGYFHQDWTLDHQNWVDAVATYRLNVGLHEANLTGREIQELASQNTTDDAALGELLSGQFGCYYIPRPDLGDPSVHDWLLEVAGALRR